MFRRIAFTAVLAATLTAAGCDEGLPLEATPTLVVQMSIAPDPGVAVASSGVTFEQDGQTMEFPWMTTLSLIIRTDAAQAGATIRNIGASVQESIDGIAVTPVVGDPIPRWRFIPRAASNRVEPGGEAIIEFDVWYWLPGGGGEAFVALNATLSADVGGGVTDAVQVLVVPQSGS